MKRPPTKSLPDAAYLREILSYCQESGILTWKPRSLNHFRTKAAWKTWNRRYANKLAGRSDAYVYISLKIKGKARSYLAHRLIFAMMGQSLREEDELDHEDGNGLNNRWKNLRKATHAQNQMNSKRERALPKGVTESRGKFRATIKHAGKFAHLGTFESIEEASKCYQERAFALFGAFAKV